MTGTVVEFDDDKGYGTAEAADGRRFFFHCTAITDGSRTIAPGAEISFDVVAGHLGRWEAVGVRPREAARP